MRRVIVTVAGGLFALFLAALCNAQSLTLSPKQEAWVREHQTVRVAVYTAGWPPFEEWNNGQPRGLGIDYLSETLPRLGLTPRYVPFDSWPEMVRAACDGEVDLVMNISITAQRTECLVFTREYARVPVAVVAHVDDPRPALSSDFRGLRIVTERGFSTGDSAQEQYPRATHIYVDTTTEALQAVENRTADLYVGNAYVAAHLIDEGGFGDIGLIRVSALPAFSIHFAAPNANRALAEAINVAMQAAPQAGRESIELRWLPDLRWINADDSILTEEEEAALKKPLRLAFPPSAAPIIFADDSGRPGGLVSDYLGRFEEMGATFVPTQGATAGARGAAQQTEVDAVIAALDPLDASRDWIRSQPIVTVPNVIVVRSGANERVIDLRALSNRTIAISDPARLERLVSRTARAVTFIHASDAEHGLELVRGRKADAYVGNLAVVDAALRGRFAGELQVSAPAGFDDSFVLSVRKERYRVVSAFDRMLASMSPRERSAIRNDWLAVEYGNGIDWQRVSRWLVPILVAIAIALLMHARGYRRLRDEVRQRRALERRFAEVTFNLPAVVYQASADEQGRIVFPFVVGDLVPMFGISAEQAMADGQLLVDRVEPSDRVRLREAIDRAIEGDTGVDMEFRARSGNGWRWIRANSLPYQAEDQRRHWTGYWIDVTDQHRQWQDLLEAKSSAENAARAKADFLATMSHEIRTPMNGVVGLLEVLSHTPLDDEQDKILDTIEDSALMLRRILDDILDFSRLEAGALTLQPRLLDIRDIAYGTVRMFEPLYEEKGLEVSASVDAGVAPQHVGDDVRLRQVLFNLMSNAMKFTEQGGVSLVIRSTSEADGVQSLTLVVTDTGIGIAPEVQKRLFQPFSQAETATTRRIGGTGLGLSICQRIVALMGGTMTLRSTPAVGTQVCVEFPLRLATEGDRQLELQRIQEEDSNRSPASRGGLRVLIAEDHPTNRILMTWYMKQLGLHHDLVSDGRQALAALERNTYDLLITDGRMPVMDGYELARAIRSQETREGTTRLPIVAITASVYGSEAELWKASGMDGFLAKPVSLKAIRSTVDRFTRGDALAPDGSDIPSLPPAALAPVDALVGLQARLANQYGSIEVAVAMLASFCDTTRKDLKRLAQLRAGALEVMAPVLHHLAGGLYTVEQPSLGERANAVRQGLLSGVEEARSELTQLVTDVEALVETIEAELHGRRV